MSNKSIQRTSSLKFSRILKRNKTISQINVTPMVDVMLVLLVIFMITAPLLTVGVPINLKSILEISINIIIKGINKISNIIFNLLNIALLSFLQFHIGFCSG